MWGDFSERAINARRLSRMSSKLRMIWDVLWSEGCSIGFQPVPRVLRLCPCYSACENAAMEAAFACSSDG